MLPPLSEGVSAQLQRHLDLKSKARFIAAFIVVTSFLHLSHLQDQGGESKDKLILLKN